MSELIINTLKLITVAGMAFVVWSVCLERIKNTLYGLKYNNFNNKRSIFLSIQRIKLKKDFTYMIHLCENFGQLSDYQEERLRENMNAELSKFFKDDKYRSVSVQNFIKKEE